MTNAEKFEGVFGVKSDIITSREAEIIDAIFKMGLGRLDAETYPQDEVDKVIYKALKLMIGR